MEQILKVARSPQRINQQTEVVSVCEVEILCFFDQNDTVEEILDRKNFVDMDGDGAVLLVLERDHDAVREDAVIHVRDRLDQIDHISVMIFVAVGLETRVAKSVVVTIHSIRIVVR
jgi:hypothetical protein